MPPEQSREVDTFHEQVVEGIYGWMEKSMPQSLGRQVELPAARPSAAMPPSQPRAPQAGRGWGLLSRGFPGGGAMGRGNFSLCTTNLKLPGCSQHIRNGRWGLPAGQRMMQARDIAMEDKDNFCCKGCFL
jgi:hypothetical protein